MPARQVPDDVRDALAKAISTRRKEEGISQQAMGKKLLGLTQQAIVKAEQGDAGAVVLRNFLEVYRLTESDLLEQFGDARAKRRPSAALADYLKAHFRDSRVREAVIADPKRWSPTLAVVADRMARKEEHRELTGEQLLGIAEKAMRSTVVHDDFEAFGLEAPPPIPRASKGRPKK